MSQVQSTKYSHLSVVKNKETIDHNSIKLVLVKQGINSRNKTFDIKKNIREIYEIISGKSDYLTVDNVSLESLCKHIRFLQTKINESGGKEAPEAKSWLSEKNKKKDKLGFVYFQIDNKRQQKSEGFDEKWSGFVVIDIDVYDEDFNGLIECLKQVRFVKLIFKSPSGGLKIVVQTDLAGHRICKKTFQYAYGAICETLVKAGAAFEFDCSGKNNTNRELKLILIKSQHNNKRKALWQPD